MKHKFMPEVIVGALITDKKGRIFLMASPKFDNHYVPPGGHVEYSERLQGALRREITEETGLNIEDIEFLNVDELITDKHHYIFVNYVCRKAEGTLKLNDEGYDGHFFTLAEAEQLPLADSCRKMIQYYELWKMNKFKNTI
jgi:nucleoside triphosphatase